MTFVLVPGATATKQRVVDLPAPTVGRALLNFGMGLPEARTFVAAPAIAATSNVMAQRLIMASASHTEDEHAVEDLEVFAGYIRAGQGFTIVGRPVLSGRLFGIFNVTWHWWG